MVAVALLGPVHVTTSGGPVEVTAPMQRAVLAFLALSRGHAATMDQLVDALWADPPARAVNNVQQYISALRRILGAAAVLTTGHGYQLVVSHGGGDASIGRDGVDADRFHTLLVRAQTDRREGDPASAAEHLADALALHRGEPLGDLPDSPFVEPSRARLHRSLLEARILAATLENDLGHYSAALELVEALAGDQPLNENVAAERMRALARSGRQADALAVYEQFRVHLDEELGLEPGPALRAAQTAVLTQDQAFAAEPPSLGTITWAWLSDTVPNPPTVVLGREHDIDRVEATLGAGTRLVTLLGTGGIGKTRLAIEVALRAQARGRHVAYVALDRISAAEQVLPAIAETLRVRESGETDLVTRVGRALRAMPLLLVLDNFEHVVAASHDLSRLVAAAGPGVQILVTSRESLRVQGEHLHRLDPLATSDPEAQLESGGSAQPETMSPLSPAEELFWQRAQAVNPAIRPSGDRPAVAALCRRLDGLPLAIELAAARVAMLSPTELLARLSHGHGVLSVGARDAPDRQRSLRACLEWSVDTLTPDERRLFACLSVFAGGATLTDVEAVAGAVIGGRDVLALTDSLVSKSLLTVTSGTTGPRLEMLETMQKYAAELLAAGDDQAQAWVAQATHFHRVLAQRPNLLPWPPRNAAEADRLVETLPNVRVALATLAGTGQYELYSDLVVSIYSILQLRGALAEATSYVTPLLERHDQSPKRRIELLVFSSEIAHKLGDYTAARSHLGAASRIVKEYPDPVQEAYLHSELGRLSTNFGDYVGAAAALIKAREAAERADDPEITAGVDAYLVMIKYDIDSIPRLEAALATARLHHNQILERLVLINLSDISLCASDLDVVALGISWGREGCRVSMMLGDLDSAAMGLSNAGAAGVLSGVDIDRAIGELLEAMELAHRVNDVLTTVECLLRLSAAEVLRRDTARARRLYGYWRELNAEYKLGMQESNQRFRDICLTELEDDDCALLNAENSLRAAVAFALGGSPHEPLRTPAGAEGTSKPRPAATGA